MKSVVATLCALLLAVLVLPVAVSLLASVPAVQNAIVKRVVGRFSEKIGTRVSIDRIDVKLINRVEINGLYVEDFGGDTLIHVPRLVAPIVELGLMGEPLTFGRVELEGAQVWLRKDVDDDGMNISRLVDSLRGDAPSKPSKKPFRLHIMEIEADGLTFGLVRPDTEPRQAGVDFGRFVLSGAHARIDDFDLEGSSITMNIGSIGGRERSGLLVDELAARRLAISRGSIVLDDVSVRSRGTVARLPSIRMESPDGDWGDFGDFTDSVRMDITMSPSRLTTDLLAAFAPSLDGWGVALDEVALSASGPLAALSGRVERARTLGTELSVDFTSRGLPDFERAFFDVAALKVTTNGGDIGELMRAATGSEPAAGVAEILARLGHAELKGSLKGGLSDFTASGAVISALGNLDVSASVTNATVSAGKATTTIEGSASVSRFEIGRLLGIADLGAVTGEFSGKGTLGGDTPKSSTKNAKSATTKSVTKGTLQGRIAALGLRDYTYSGLTIDGEADGRFFDATISADDPALALDLTAAVDLSTDTPNYSLDLNLTRADLARMNIVADSIAVVSGRVVAQVSGTGLDDVNGTVELNNARYLSPDGEVATSQATLSGRNSPTGKLITLRSEFADGEFRSRTGYKDMLAYLGGFLRRYIPLTIFGEAAEALVPPDGGNPAAMSNYSIVSLNIKNVEPLLSALAPTASLAEGSSARFMFNPYTGSFSLSAASEYVEYRGMLAANIEVTADNAADSLALYLSGSDLYSGRGHIPSFALHGGSKGSHQLDIRLDERMWRITADSLGYAEGRTILDNLNIFTADNPGQRLSATGVISKSPTDTLRLQLSRFDLSLPGRLLQSLGLDVSGRATGRLDLSAILDNPRIDADIELRNLAANGMEAPPLRFTSQRDDAGQGVRFRLLDETSNIDVVRGSLSTQGEIDAAVRLDSLDAALLDPILSGIVADTRGRGNARLTLGGTFANLKIDGTIEVPRLETTVGYTGVTYSVSGARLTFANSVLTLPSTPVHNRLGGAGDVAMTVDMSNFKSIAVGIDARMRGLLAFDTGPGDSEAFYGRVFATGSMGIRSGQMGTTMDISARSDAGTQIHLPLNAKSNVSWADFVVFDNSSAMLDSTDVLERKKLAYERQLRGGGGAARSKPLELNLTASITPAAELFILIDPNLGQGISARGEGVIDMEINPTNNLFTMTGDYNITAGRFEFSMMNVFNKTFEITPGSTMRWSGAPDDALLSVDASYRVRTSLQPLLDGAGGSGGMSSRASVPVDCIIRLRERLSEPEITFDIALPSADTDQRQLVADAMNTQELKSMQFLSLLATGSFAADNSISGQFANAGVMATGAVGFDILTNQLNNFLSSDDYDIFFRYRPQENAGSQVDMGFSTGFWDDRLQLEIEGNYVDDRAATSVGATGGANNFSGDVSLTWVIDRAGNVRLKAFSRSIDRFNETRGLQESGIGVHYSKNFDAVGDIFRRRTNRPGNKNSKFAPGPPSTGSITEKE
ncbi:MAG: translocation/assembly module TamB domain-containing protein [Alistipes sp.]|nr:translocation/assembly module TamB domain-containing protein [Alistipes sp.]